MEKGPAYLILIPQSYKLSVLFEKFHNECTRLKGMRQPAICHWSSLQ